MSTNSNFDRIAEAWLAEGPTQLADRALHAALDEVHLTRQRRRLTAPWRFDLMFTPVRLAAAAVIGVLLVGVIYLNLPGRNDVGGPSPSPIPSTTVEPTIGPAPTPTPPWQSFTSERFGYTVQMPGDFVESPLVDDLPDEFYPGDEAQYGNRFDNPVTHNPSILIAVVTPPAPQTVAGYQVAFDEATDSFCDILARETVTIDGIEARMLTVDCTAFGWYDVGFERNGQFWDIGWSNSPTNLPADRPAFEQLIASFDFTN